MENREPCPTRIFDDMGGAFTMGLIGGGLFSMFRGAKQAPSQGIFLKTASSKFMAGVQQVRTSSPTVGGAFAAWGGTFSAFDCTLAYMRKKEDPINSIVSGGLTGFALAARQGWKIASFSAVMGAVILAMIEGVTLLTTKYMGSMMNPMEMQPVQLEDPSVLAKKVAAAATGASSNSFDTQPDDSANKWNFS